MDKKEQQEIWHHDSKNWKLGFIYYNKEDKRWFAPKRIGLMGWTLNFAHPISYLLLVAIFAIAFVMKTYIKK